MKSIDLEFAMTKILSEAQQAKFENKVLLELLIERGIMTKEEFENRYHQRRIEMSEIYLTEELGITVEELRQLVLS